MKTDLTAPPSAGAAAPVLEPSLAAPATSAGWRWALVAGGAVALGLAAGCEKIWDLDVPWHLAAGDWMLAHGAILRQDYWSTGAPRPWMDVYWLFHLLMSWLHGWGGFEALVGLKMAMLGGVVAVLALAGRKRAARRCWGCCWGCWWWPFNRASAPGRSR